jgi:hypothetical protein
MQPWDHPRNTRVARARRRSYDYRRDARFGATGIVAFRVYIWRHRPMPAAAVPKKPGRPMTLRPELSKASWRRTRKAVRRRDGERCVVCGSNGWIPPHVSKSGRVMPGRVRLVVGHVVPFERSGMRHDDPRNLRTMCVRCNNSQRDLSDEQWREARAARGQDVGPVAERPRGRTIFNRSRPRVL